MKIRELIENLLKDNDLDDEVIIAYWDKNYFVEWGERPKEEVDRVWLEFAKKAQANLDADLDFTELNFLADIDEAIEEKEKGK